MPRRPAAPGPRSASDILKLLGAQLRRLRLERGITQGTLSRRSGYNYKHIGRIELAKAEPGAVALVRLARAMHVSVGELFETITPSNASGYRVSPADVEAVHEALASVDEIMGRVTTGRPGPLRKRAPRARR